jgi:sigma-B regulation protein RsbU (phosphoserine phosphatase)
MPSNRPICVLLLSSDQSPAESIRSALGAAPGGLRFTVEHLDRCQTGKGRIARGGVDAVLLNLDLPDAPGLESLKQLRLQSAQMPIVVLTKSDDDTLGLDSIHHGAQDFLSLGNGFETSLQRSIRYAIERRRAEATEGQLELAHSIQQRLFPKNPPLLPGYDLAAVCHPASITAGDYYDFFPICDGTAGMVVADVSGHGFGPALLMAETRAYLRALSRTCPDIGEILANINLILAEDTAPDQFVTLFFAQLDVSRRKLNYCGAGHNAHLLDPSGEYTTLDSTSMPLAVDRDELFQLTRQVQLAVGDVLVMMTDGVMESCNSLGELFGVERAMSVVKNHFQKPASEIVELLYEEVREFAGARPQDDDITILVVKAIET